MSYYKDQDLKPEVRERNVRDVYKRLHKLESEIVTLQEENRRLELNYDLCLEEGKDRISVLQEENEEIKNSLSLIDIDNSKLELKNKKLREALEYYADKDNWTYSELITLEGDNGEAIFYTEIKDDDKFEIGGRRARKALEAK